MSVARARHSEAQLALAEPGRPGGVTASGWVFLGWSRDESDLAADYRFGGYVAVRAVTTDKTLPDVNYAITSRDVTPIEQHVHSFLEMVPVMAVAFLSVLHWPQLLALLGIGPNRPDWQIRRKRHPVSGRYLATMLTAQVVLEWFPYLEELWRTLRTEQAITKK